MPSKITELVNVDKVSCGLWHMLALTKEGLCLSAGSNKAGELGHSQSSGFHPVEMKQRVNDVSAGYSVSFFICSDGLYSCGKAPLNLQKTNKSEPTITQLDSIL